MGERVDLAELVAVAIAAATQAGHVIRQIVEEHTDLQVVEKGDTVRAILIAWPRARPGVLHLRNGCSD